MRVLAFGASNSSKSINKRFATYAAHLIKDSEVEILDLNDYELPLYSEDREKDLGKPEKAVEIIKKFSSTDLILISLAEHNGSYTAAFKNIIDWCSRLERDFFGNKPIIFLATSPGPRGAKSVLDFAQNSAHFFAGDVKGTFSLPSFFKNFDTTKNVISDPELKSELEALLEKVTSALTK